MTTGKVCEPPAQWLVTPKHPVLAWLRLRLTPQIHCVLPKHRAAIDFQCIHLESSCFPQNTVSQVRTLSSDLPPDSWRTHLGPRMSGYFDARSGNEQLAPQRANAECGPARIDASSTDAPIPVADALPISLTNERAAGRRVPSHDLRVRSKLVSPLGPARHRRPAVVARGAGDDRSGTEVCFVKPVCRQAAARQVGRVRPVLLTPWTCAVP
jgi:hypothetical protein